MQPFMFLHHDLMTNTTPGRPDDRRIERIRSINLYHNQIIQLINLKYEDRVNR